MNCLTFKCSRLIDASWFFMVALLFAICLLPAAVIGQSATATLSGDVIDQNGAVVVGAEVKIVNPLTAFSRQATTNDSGSYAFPLLPPGTYSVTVQRDGFSPIRIESLVLNVGDQKGLQIQLKAGGVNAQVTIDSGAEAIKTDGSVSTVVDTKFVEKMPLNGRSFQSLILLTPGVTTNTPQSSALTGNTGEFSVNGQRTESNIYMVDGVSANNGTYVLGFPTAGNGGGVPTSTAIGSTQSLISIDALQEFRVSSSTYAAEFGRSPGGQFSFVSKAGTKDFHGSAFEYIRNDALDANDWFNNSLKVRRPVERQHDFGGTVGGQVMLPRFGEGGRQPWYNGRNRTFFFFSYEGLRLRQPLAASITYVPSLALRQNAPAVLQGPLNAYPLPTGATLSSGLAEYLLTDSLPSSLNSTSIRIDHNLSSSARLFFRFTDTPSRTRTRSVAVYSTNRFAARTYTLGASVAFSNRLINDFHLGYSLNQGGNERELVSVDGAKPLNLYQVMGVDRAAHPSASVFVGLFFPDFASDVDQAIVRQHQNQLNVNDAVDFVTGGHHFRFGADLLQTASELGRSDPNVNSVFDSSSAVIANRSFFSSATRYGESSPVYRNLSVFAQDEWRLTQRLNLSLGVRWELAPSPTVSRGVLPRVLSGSITQPSSLQLAPEGTRFYETTFNNFAPRFGISYVLRNSPGRETVLRGGFGVFYDSGQNIASSAFEINPGSYAAKNYSNVSFPLTPAQLNVSVADSLVAPYPFLYVFGDPAAPFKLPYTMQWNVTAEQGFGSEGVLSLAYVGAHGSRLPQKDLRNISSFNSNFSTVGITKNGLTSDYDALQAQFQRRLNRGVQVLASYTWAHAIDWGSTNISLPVKRGDSDYDLRHSLTAAVTYDVPALFSKGWASAITSHWSLDGRFSLRSAFPITLNGSTIIDPLTHQQYPAGLDLIPGVPLYLYNSIYPGGRRVNPAAFKKPAAGQIANAPRNFVRGFGANQVDLVLRRAFPLSEQVRLQLGWEAFNVFNHPNFGLINTSSGNPQFGLTTKMLSTSLGGLSPLYQQGGARSMQGSVRLTF